MTVRQRRFSADRPGQVEPEASAIPDLGSRRSTRNAIVTGPGAAEQPAANGALPAWARSLAAGGLRCPTTRPTR